MSETAEEDRSTTGANISFVAGAAFLQIVLQFLFSRILANYYGASAESDALNAALVLPTVCYSVVTGSLSYVLIPELVSKFNTGKDSTAAWQLAYYVATVIVVLCSTLTGILYFNSSNIVAFLYPDMLSEQASLTTGVLQILSFQVLLNGLVSWTQSVHHSRHRFLLPALGGVVGMVCSLLLAQSLGHQGVHVIAWAINLGSLVSFLVQCLPLLKHLRFPKAEQQHIFGLLNRLWPLLLGAAFIRLDPLVDRVLAAELDTGSVTHIHFAQRILAALLAIGSSSLALVAFPQLAEKYTQLGIAGFKSHFTLSTRRVMLLIIPIAIGVSLFSVEIITDLLQTGRFTRDDSVVVGWLVFVLMGMFLGASAGEMLAQGFYVQQDTKTPSIIGVFCLLFAFLVKFVLFKYYIGIWGIALGVSLYFLMAACLMAFVLSKRVGGGLLMGLLPAALQACLASLLACGACWMVYFYRPLFGSIGATWIAAPVGVVGYGLCLLFFGNEDAKSAVNYGMSRLGLRKRES